MLKGWRLPVVARTVGAEVVHMLGFVMRSDWGYLMRHAAEGIQRDGDAERPAERDPLRYYLEGAEHGEPPGRWWGSGAEALGLTGDVVEAQMKTLYGALEHPATREALGTRPRTYAPYEERLAKLLAREPDPSPERRAALELAAHKAHREARHYADLTFSPTKSWSVLHAALEQAGRHDEAEQVWASWEAGVHAGLRYLMDEAGYSRKGYFGAPVAGRSSGEWIDAHGWVVSLWRHHTSRDGDPQLHVHAAVVNRVECADGVWRSLDSKAIAAARPAAGAIAERVAEEDLTRALGAEFRMRPDGIAREIAGIDQEVRDLFSSRRHAISAGVADLVTAYEARHGKPPTPYTLRLMAEHVTLATRARKPDHSPSREQLLSGWDRSMRQRLGTSLGAVLEAVRLDPNRVLGDATPFSPSRVIAQAIADVERTKAVWNRHDVVAALIRHLPDELGGLSEAQVRGLVGQLADTAVGTDPGVVTLTAPAPIPVPKELLRDDGQSRFAPHRPERYATARQLEREERLLAAARQTGAPRLPAAEVERAVGGARLAGEQADVVRAILGSGRRVEVLVGPAGTGKSHTMGQLVGLWKEAFDAGSFGIATAENAVHVLRGEGIERGANVAKFLQFYERLAQGTVSDTERRRFEVRAGELLVIDEASMVSTAEFSRIVQIGLDAGAKVVVTGDPNQLDAIDAGGAMRMLTEHVDTLQLSEVRRFAREWERAASLALRAGNADVLLEYDRHGRLLDGSPEQMREAAYTAFVNDTLAGKRSLLLTGSVAEATALSSEVRQQLIALGRVDTDGVPLRGGTAAGIGDLVQTRENHSWLIDARTGTPFTVLNRDVWRVVGRGDDGALMVRQQLGRDDLGEQRWGPERELPPTYVAHCVDLAYASTMHAAQGRTVDTAHTLVDEWMDRASLYVGMSRGVVANVAYVMTGKDEHRLQLLSAVLDRDLRERTAIEVQAEEYEAVRHLGRLGPEWSTLVAERQTARHHETLRAVLGEERTARFDADPAAGALYRLLRTAELDGADALEVLTQAVGRRELDTAGSIAEVLYHRVRHDLEQDVRPSGVPETATTAPTAAEFTPRGYVDRTPDVGDDPVGRYVRRLAEAMDERTTVLAEQAAMLLPAWVEPLGPVPDDPLAREEWTARAAAVASYREHFGQHSATDPIGRRPGFAEPERRAAWEQAAAALGMPPEERDLAGRSDAELANRIDAYQREEAWMPPNVDERLRSMSIAARDSEGRVARLRAELEMPDHAGDDRADLERRVAAAQALAERTAQRAAELEEIAEARTVAVATVADVEERARAARDELDRRGIDPATLEPVAQDGASHAGWSNGVGVEDATALAVRGHTGRESVLEDADPRTPVAVVPSGREHNVPEPEFAEERSPVAIQRAGEPEVQAEHAIFEVREPRAVGPEPEVRDPAAEDRDIARDLERAREAMLRIEARDAEAAAQIRHQPAIDEPVPVHQREPERYQAPEAPVPQPDRGIERDL